MAFLTEAEAALAGSIARLATCNPFLPDRLSAEQAILQARYRPYQEVWSVQQDLPEESPNVRSIAAMADSLVTDLARRLREGATPGDAETALYENLAIYVIYERCQRRFHDWAPTAHLGSGPRSWKPHFQALRRDLAELLEVSEVLPGPPPDPAHLLSFFFQVHCAFQHVFRCMVGKSLAVARLRAAAWESIFTHDILRYFRTLYRRMADLNTLITGPSGTGKELVARAIGLSRYLPFDPESCTFAASPGGTFIAVSLSALSPTLIESEIFGHRRGAFTGALEDRPGRFAACGEHGTVFLDEIGEVDPSIQVKLLRVLESRTFTRIGGRREHRFEGKLVAATNRDLDAEMQAGRFREDLYYRLCSDVIATPSLREQLDDDPDELRHLVSFVVHRIAGEHEEELAEEVIDWIVRELGPSYPWPGNFRELEQCVRNLMVRRDYRPPTATRAPAVEELTTDVAAGRLTADELLGRYATLVYAKAGTFEEAGRRLGLDRRTVKRRVDPEFLERLSE